MTAGTDAYTFVIDKVVKQSRSDRALAAVIKFKIYPCEQTASVLRTLNEYLTRTEA